VRPISFVPSDSRLQNRFAGHFSITLAGHRPRCHPFFAAAWSISLVISSGVRAFIRTLTVMSAMWLDELRSQSRWLVVPRWEEGGGKVVRTILGAIAYNVKQDAIAGSAVFVIWSGAATVSHESRAGDGSASYGGGRGKDRKDPGMIRMLIRKVRKFGYRKG